MKTLAEYLKFMVDNKIDCLIWSYQDCPLDEKYEKYELTHGDDEDSVILYRGMAHHISSLPAKLAVYDHNELKLEAENGEYFYLAVTAHA